jgi:hypothetical protein
MNNSKQLISYYTGFDSHLQFDEDKKNLEKDHTELKPLDNLILSDLNKSNDDDFNIRQAYLGWNLIFLHITKEIDNDQQSELYNLCYNNIYKTRLIRTNCKLSNPFDLRSLKCNNKETYLICNDRKVWLFFNKFECIFEGIICYH